MKPWLKITLPVAIIAGAAGVVALMFATRQKPHVQPAAPKPTLVETMTASLQTETLVVRAQGTVAPLRETVLIPEVSGRIIRTAPAFEAGGFFEEGDALVELDPSNQEAAVSQAEFNLAQARLKLEQEKARADQARREWASLSSGDAPPLAVRTPQLQAEEASVRWAEQALEKARLDLARTVVRAPYAGMVRTKLADVGQFVGPGTQLGAVFSVDFAEIRLPLSADELAFIDLPQPYRGEPIDVGGTPVKLRARIAGEDHLWTARIVRTEGVINPTNRMLYAVARVENPYGRGADGNRPPLQVGTFVEAEIEGRTIHEVVVLPRRVLRGANHVLVVDAGGELRSRVVGVLRADETQVILGTGLAAGEKVCTTALEFIVEGMKVEVMPDAPVIDPAAASQLADGKESTGEKPVAKGGPL